MVVNRRLLLEYIEYFINYSEFIPQSLVEYAKSIDDDEKLEKLFLIIFSALSEEKALSREEKDTLRSIQTDFTNEITMLYQKSYIEMIKKVEDKEKMNNQILENVFNSI